MLIPAGLPSIPRKPLFGLLFENLKLLNYAFLILILHHTMYAYNESSSITSFLFFFYFIVLYIFRLSSFSVSGFGIACNSVEFSRPADFDEDDGSFGGHVGVVYLNWSYSYIAGFSFRILRWDSSREKNRGECASDLQVGGGSDSEVELHTRKFCRLRINTWNCLLELKVKKIWTHNQNSEGNWLLWFFYLFDLCDDWILLRTGRKATHDFLSLYSSSAAHTQQDPSPAQGTYCFHRFSFTQSSSLHGEFLCFSLYFCMLQLFMLMPFVKLIASKILKILTRFPYQKRINSEFKGISLVPYFTKTDLFYFLFQISLLILTENWCSGKSSKRKVYIFIWVNYKTIFFLNCFLGWWCAVV